MPDNRQPWPMKWVVLVIVVCIGAYTFLTLRYRKKGPSFLPYEDMQNRSNTARLLSAGYQRIEALAERPAESGRAPGGALIANAPGGLPTDLRTTLVITPLLPVEIDTVAAAPTSPADHPYALQLTCTLPNEKEQLHGAQVYVRGKELVIVPTFEHIGSDLVTRSRAAAVLITIPGSVLKPGSYQVLLVAERSSRAWTLDVK